MWFSTYKTELPVVAYKSILYIEGFTVVDVDASTNRKCIQFIDKRGTTYALKVINGTNLSRFEVGKSNLNLNVFEACLSYLHFFYLMSATVKDLIETGNPA